MNRKLLIILTLLNVFFGYSQITVDATLLEFNFDPESNPKNLTKSNLTLYFTADDGVNGIELWKSDGTENGTVLVKNINPSSDSDASNFIDINDVLFFTADDGTNGEELWKSDGTENGTILVKNINPSSDSDPSDFTNVNGTLFFTANDGTNGKELWKSDGTENGTVLVKNLNSANSTFFKSFLDINGTLFFSASDGTYGQELWKSDGTENGTVMVKNINPSNYGSSNPRSLTNINGTLFFSAYDGTNTNGYELWKSDGTENGTVLVKNINTSGNSNVSNLININGIVYFSANDGTNGDELWKSNGTENGTVLIKNINLNPNQGSINSNFRFAIHENKLYFQADDGINGYELWITDGTESGTQLLKDINTGLNSSSITKITSTNSFVFFSARNDINNYNTLWKSDGTTIGTSEVLNIDLSQDSSTELTILDINNTIYFQAKELWRTDGSSMNTSVVKEINRTRGTKTQSSSRNYTGLNNQIIYTGQSYDTGNEVFVSDGTISGTHILKDINPTPNVGSFGFSSTCPSPSFTKVDNALYFRARNGLDGYELFKTDGTENGTVMVKDIATGDSDGLETMFFAEYNDNLYFRADDGESGSELWRTDGTEGGTYLLKDINPNSESSIFSTNEYNPCQIRTKKYTIFNNLLYFKAHDGSSDKIWKTDGTNSGTVPTTMNQSGIVDFEIIDSNNSNLFVWSNLNYSDIPELWSSDGTREGNTLLYTYQLVTQGLNKSSFVFNDELYFSETLNSVLMKSDGTLNGTVVVKDLEYSPTFIGICGSYLYFTIGNKALWRTNGTNVGTIEVGDFTTGNFRSHVIFENTLFILNSLDDKVIHYINDSMNSTGYLNINVVNSNNFSGFDTTWHLSNTDDNLFLDADTRISGDELYKIDVSEISLSVDDFFENNNSDVNIFNVYPNPSDSQVVLSSKDNIIIDKVEIYNSLGKRIIIITQNNNLIDLSKLNIGLYFLKIYANNKIETHKILKE